MQFVPAPALTTSPVRPRPRTALVASADRSFRQRITETLSGLRWQVREVEGGAQAWAEAEAAAPEAIIVDSWLPDLEMNEFLREFRGSFPNVDVVTAHGETELNAPRGPYRQELLYALRRSQDSDTAVWNAAPMLSEANAIPARRASLPALPSTLTEQVSATANLVGGSVSLPGSVSISGKTVPIRSAAPAVGPSAFPPERLPELVGKDPCMLEVTGLESDSTALNTIANDLSNMNTTAFKGQSTNFSDLFYQQIGATGSGDPIELGAGVKVASNETIYSQGSINATGNATDVAINGNGFFVVDPTSGGQEFTRAGDFSLTSTGALVTTGGAAVMGYAKRSGQRTSSSAVLP
jgi:CheY-like chemotaxis protein